MTSTPWPERRMICMQCRQTFTDDPRQRCCNRTPLALDRRSDRDRLITHVWGMTDMSDPASRRRATKRVIGMGLSGFGVLVASLAASGVLVTPFTLLGILSLVGGVMTVFGGAIDMAALESEPRLEFGRRERDEPLPGDDPPLLLGGSSGLLGTVDRGHESPAPLSGVAAVAFSITLTADREEGGRLLIDAATRGFIVTTNDGEEIAIPPGSLTIIGHGGRFIDDVEAIDRYLLELDPLRKFDRDADPFGHQAAIEITVRIADHVVIHNGIKRCARPSWLGDLGPEQFRGYRDMAPAYYTVEGAPYVELLHVDAHV